MLDISWTAESFLTATESISRYMIGGHYRQTKKALLGTTQFIANPEVLFHDPTDPASICGLPWISFLFDTCQISMWGCNVWAGKECHMVFGNPKWWKLV